MFLNNNDSTTKTGTKSVLHGNWLTGLKTMGWKWARPECLYPWDPTGGPIDLQSRSWNGPGKPNLRIKESHLLVVLIAQGTKDKLSFQQFVFFLFGLLNQAFQEASHFLSGMVRMLNPPETPSECPTRGSQVIDLTELNPDLGQQFLVTAYGNFSLHWAFLTSWCTRAVSCGIMVPHAW